MSPAGTINLLVLARNVFTRLTISPCAFATDSLNTEQQTVDHLLCMTAKLPGLKYSLQNIVFFSFKNFRKYKNFNCRFLGSLLLHC